MRYSGLGAEWTTGAGGRDGRAGERPRVLQAGGGRADGRRSRKWRHGGGAGPGPTRTRGRRSRLMFRAVRSAGGTNVKLREIQIVLMLMADGSSLAGAESFPIRTGISRDGLYV